MLARPYLMTIHVIFSIHVNFPIKSRFVLKAIINRIKQWTVLCYLRKFFFQKDAFYDIVQLCCIWLIFPFYYNLFIFLMFLYDSFHVKWTKLGHDSSQILMKLFQVKGILIGLSWKFQNKLIICSKVMTPQSWHFKLKIDKTKGGRQLQCISEPQ